MTTTTDTIRRLNVNYWTEDTPLEPVTSPLDADITTDVVVIGAGYAGLCTAWHLRALRPDLGVVVVDAGVVGAGSSSRNAGMVEPVTTALVWLVEKSLPDGHAAWAFNHLVQRIHGAVEQLGIARVDAEIAPSPVVLGAPSALARELLRSMRDQLTTIGTDCDWVEREESAERWGIRSRGTLVTAGYSLHPVKLIHGLRDLALAGGVELHERTPISNVSALPRGGFLATTRNGATIRARHVVDAASVWSRSLGLSDRTDSMRHTFMFATDPLPTDLLAQAGSDPTGLVGEVDLTVSYRRVHGGRLLYGAFGDRSDNPDLPLGMTAGERLRTHAIERMPWLDGVAIDCAWGGPIKHNPTDLPSIGWIPDRPGALSVAGNSGCGIPWCLVGGEMVANLIADDGSTDPDLERIRANLSHTRVPWLTMGELGLSWLWGAAVH